MGTDDRWLLLQERCRICVLISWKFVLQFSIKLHLFSARCCVKHILQNKHKNFRADSRWTQYKPKTRHLRDHRDAPMRYQQTVSLWLFPHMAALILDKCQPAKTSERKTAKGCFRNFFLSNIGTRTIFLKWKFHTNYTLTGSQQSRIGRWTWTFNFNPVGDGDGSLPQGSNLRPCSPLFWRAALLSFDFSGFLSALV